MTHSLRTTLAAISLVLCGLSAGACVVSYVMPFEIENSQVWSDSHNKEFCAAHDTTITVTEGTLYLYRSNIARAATMPQASDRYVHRFVRHVAGNGLRTPWLPAFTRTVGRGFVVGKWWAIYRGKTELQWTLPLWLLTLAFAILPVRWAILRRRERRRNAAKLCGRCGYDLRACVERCSECGEPIPAPPACGPLRVPATRAGSHTTYNATLSARGS